MQKEIAIPNAYFSVCELASTTTIQFLVQIFFVLMTIVEYMKILVHIQHNRYDENAEKKSI